MTGKALVFEKERVLDNLLMSLLCSLSDFFVDGHVSLFQNGGRFLNP
jgi:hypothetical protein